MERSEGAFAGGGGDGRVRFRARLRHPQSNFPQGLKPTVNFMAFTARLKSCPFKATASTEFVEQVFFPMSEQTTIAVAMSGGVDSSTAAAMLAHSGETVVGLTLQLWDQTRLAGKHGIPDAPKAGRCCSLDDVYDARKVAEHLGIPYYVVNQQERFERDVVRPFVDEYLAGARRFRARFATTTSSSISSCRRRAALGRAELLLAIMR